MTLPRVQPIIPTLRAPFDDPSWVFELKYDGFRGLRYLERGHCRFISRNGNVLGRLDALCDQVAAEIRVDDAILDGEVIVADETGRPQFYDLLRGTRAPAYVVFDLLWLNGADLRPLPLSERRRRPQTILQISEALSVEGRGCQLFELVRAHDLDGIVGEAPRRSVRPASQMAQDQEPALHAEGRQRRAFQPGAR